MTATYEFGPQPGPLLPAGKSLTGADLAAWPLLPPGWSPSGACGWALCTMQPGAAVTGWSLGEQTMVANLATATATTKISKLGVLLVAGGSGGSGPNAMGVFDAGGDLLAATGDMSSALSGTAGWAEGSLATSVQLVQGTSYYLGVVAGFTSTDCGLAGQAGSALPAINGLVPSVKFTSVTKLASFSPGAGTAWPGTVLMYGR